MTKRPLIATLLLKPVFIHIFLEESNMKHELASFLIKYVGHVDKESNRLIVQLIELYLSSLRVKVRLKLSLTSIKIDKF